MDEHEAQQRGVVGRRGHLELRRSKSAPVLARLVGWKTKLAPLFEPKSPMGDALRYMTNQWTCLIAFLEDPLIPIHNNASEAALRIVALARKNSMFFLETTRRAGGLLVLYSLIATCERHDVNPELYLADVLIGIHDHPRDRVADLLRTDGSRAGNSESLRRCRDNRFRVVAPQVGPHLKEIRLQKIEQRNIDDVTLQVVFTVDGRSYTAVENLGRWTGGDIAMRFDQRLGTHILRKE